MPRRFCLTLTALAAVTACSGRPSVRVREGCPLVLRNNYSGPAPTSDDPCVPMAGIANPIINHCRTSHASDLFMEINNLGSYKAAKTTALHCDDPTSLDLAGASFLNPNGVICGDELLKKYGLSNGVAQFCKNARAPLSAKRGPTENTCVVRVALSAVSSQGSGFKFFCRSTSMPGEIVISLTEMTTAGPPSSGDSVEVGGRAVKFVWSLYGTENCVQHSSGHGILPGLLQLLEKKPAQFPDAARMVLQIYSASWSHFAGTPEKAQTKCFGHPEDD